MAGSEQRLKHGFWRKRRLAAQRSGPHAEATQPQDALIKEEPSEVTENVLGVEQAAAPDPAGPLAPELFDHALSRLRAGIPQTPLDPGVEDL